MTTSGLQTDIQIATRFAPGKLQIESARGILFSDFSLQNIHYQNGLNTVQIKSLNLSWNPVGLLAHKLVIHHININQANIVIPTIPTSQSKNNSNKLNDFLKDIRIIQAHFNQVNIKIADTNIHINGGFQKNWDLQWNATIPKLATFLPDIKGSLTTSGNTTGSFLTPTLTVNLYGKNITYANQRINDLNIQGNANYAKKVLTTRFIVLINKRYTILTQLIFPEFAGINKLDQPIAGNISSKLNNLNLLTDYIPQIKEPRGTLQAAVLIKGTIAKPDITAQLNLSNGKIRIPSLGITPQDIQLQGTINLTKKLNFNGYFRSGKGRANLQGSVDFNNSDYPLTLQVKGSNLQAIDLAEYNIIISPDINLTFIKQNLTLQGTILIPEAQITPASFSSTVTLPSDVVFVDSKEAKQLPFTTSLQLSLQLGEHIHVAYHDLSTNLAGNVQLNQLPGAVINAIGELYTKKGVYKAYGQTLKIQTGRLIYTGGSLMNPGLNISAIKKMKTINTGGNVSSFTGETSLKAIYTGTENLTVGVEVTGTLDNPVFSLISTPSMPQGDILSYLVFGYPASQANGNQYGAILSALSSLNPNTPNMGSFTKNLEQKLGLTEMTVQSVQVFNPNATTSSQSVVSATSFVVGKKLSDEISIHYSIGLFNPVSILNLRYQLTKSWAIQSETSTFDNGADILYSIERD